MKLDTPTVRTVFLGALLRLRLGGGSLSLRVRYHSGSSRSSLAVRGCPDSGCLSLRVRSFGVGVLGERSVEVQCLTGLVSGSLKSVAGITRWCSRRFLEVGKHWYALERVSVMRDALRCPENTREALSQASALKGDARAGGVFTPPCICMFLTCVDIMYSCGRHCEQTGICIALSLLLLLPPPRWNARFRR